MCVFDDFSRINIKIITSMVSTEWYETVFVIGKRTNAGTFDNGKCKVFDKDGCYWIVDDQFYNEFMLPEDPCKWNQVSIL